MTRRSSALAGLAATRAWHPRQLGVALALALTIALVVGTVLLERGATGGLRAQLVSETAGTGLIVLSADGTPLDRDLPVRLAQRPEVADVYGNASSWVMLDHAGRRAGTEVAARGAGRARTVPAPTAGRFPTARDEVALPQEVADRLGVTVGDRVDLATTSDSRTSWRVVGLLDRAASPLHALDTALVTAPTLADHPGDEPTAVAVTVHDADASDLARTLRAEGLQVETDPAAWAVQRGAADDPGPLVVLLGVLTGVLTAALTLSVVASSARVLLRQRRGELALLRSLGLTHRDLLALLATESVLLGLAAGLAGLLLGTVGARLALPSVVAPVTSSTAQAVAAARLPLGVAVGAVIGAPLLALLGSARSLVRAAGVGPVGTPTGGGRGDLPEDARSRLVHRLTTGAGVAVLATALAVEISFLVGLLGRGEGVPGAPLVVLLAVVSALAAVSVARSAVVPLLAATGHVLAVLLPGRVGACVTAATADLSRDRRRAADAAGVLVLCSSLAATVLTGGATLDRSLDDAAVAAVPADVVVTPLDPDLAEISDEQLATLTRQPEVRAVVPVERGALEVEHLGVLPYRAIAPHDARTTALDPAVAGLTEGEIGLPPDLLDRIAVATGRLPLDGDLLGVGPAGTPLRVRVLPEGFGDVLLARSTARTVVGISPRTEAWVDLSDAPAASSADGRDELVARLTAVASRSPHPPVEVRAASSTGALHTDGLDTARWVAVGLVALAGSVGLLGATTTLTLSVLERRRAHQVLRAVGLTTRRLVGGLVAESWLLTCVPAAVGTVLGIVHGLALGVAACIDQGVSAHAVIPWGPLGVLAALVVLASLVGAALPAWAALRRSAPVPGGRGA